MQDETKKLDWHEVRGVLIGMVGKQVACVIDKMEDMPIETWSIQTFQGCYSSLEAAKVGAEKIFQLQQYPLERERPATFDQVMVPMLEGLLAALKGIKNAQ